MKGKSGKKVRKKNKKWEKRVKDRMHIITTYKGGTNDMTVWLWSYHFLLKPYLYSD